MSGARIEVAIAIVAREGRLLVARRPHGVHLGGLWEFPGGKISAGETPELCAVREVREELGIVVVAERQRAPITHAYAERTVVLFPIECRYVSGAIELRGAEEARWVAPGELTSFEFPEANAELVAELARST